MSRRAAALAGHLGDAAAARRFLADADPAVRATALGAVLRCGALTRQDVAGALADTDPTVRARAAELVAEWERATGNPSNLALAALLEDPDERVTEAAAFASGERAPAEPGIVDALAKVAADHRDPLCREAAVAALGAIGDPAGLAAILAATHDAPAIRRRAVLALAPFEGPDVDAALEVALGDRDWQVRQAAEDLLNEP